MSLQINRPPYGGQCVVVENIKTEFETFEFRCRDFESSAYPLYYTYNLLSEGMITLSAHQLRSIYIT